ncbi:hypothetical protein D3C80_1637200 [compost metagenome]
MMPSASAARVRRRQRAVPSAGISGLPVEVVEDHPAVVKHIAVGQVQRRDLAHGLVLVQKYKAGQIYLVQICPAALRSHVNKSDPLGLDSLVLERG